MEAEAQAWCDVRIWILFVRQPDVQADRFAADVVGAAIGGFHDSGSTAGHDHQSAIAGIPAGFTDQLAKTSRGFVVTVLGHDAFGPRQAHLQIFIVRISTQLRLQ